jgi:hypothetical protein
MIWAILTPLFLTLASEVPLALFLFQKKDIPFFLFAFLLNLVTNLSLNLTLTSLPASYSYFWSVFTGEVLVYFLEFLAYGLWTRRWIFSLLSSICLNSLSLFLGLLMNKTLENGADIRLYAMVLSGILVIELACYFAFSFARAKRGE